MALYVPGLLPDLDFDEVAAALDGRQLYVIAAEGDAIYPVEGVRLVERRVKAAGSAALGSCFHFIPGPHAFATERVVDGLRWLLSSREAPHPPSSS